MAEHMLDSAGASPEPWGRIIMVVDSSANDRFYISILLQRLGYHVCSAKTAEEALDLLSVALSALIIAEFTILQSDGVSSIQRFKQDPRTDSVPVIALTLSGDLVVKKRSLEAGAVDCLTKPIHAADLYRTVQANIEPSPRSSIRIRTRIPLTVNNAPLDYSGGECATMISENGMYVRTLKPSPVNAPLSVAMVIKGRKIALDAVVLYNHRFGQGPFGQPGMGLKFTRILPDDQAFIRQFVNDDVTRDIAPHRP